MSNLHETAPDTIYLNYGTNKAMYNEPFNLDYAADFVSWVSPDDGELDPVHIEYRKVTPDDGKFVLQGKWRKAETWDHTYFVGDVDVAHITVGGLEDVSYTVRLLADPDHDIAFYGATYAVEFVHREVSKLFDRLSPNIIIVHDDTLPEFK
jgi:hypothetical protein